MPLDVVVSLKLSVELLLSFINRLPALPVEALIELVFVRTGAVAEDPILVAADSVKAFAVTVDFVESVIWPVVLVRLTVPLLVSIFPPRSMLVPVRLTVPRWSVMAPLVFTAPAPVIVTVAGEASVMPARLRAVLP